MKQVMIVDDDPSILQAAGRVLQRKGFEVLKIPDGGRCLEAVRSGYRGVVLMDIMMPGLTGWETIRALLAEGLQEQILICMLTARPTPGPDSAGLEGLVFDYLPKPFAGDELVRLVEYAAQFASPGNGQTSATCPPATPSDGRQS